jgi:hypothetical protein
MTSPQTRHAPPTDRLLAPHESDVTGAIHKVRVSNCDEGATFVRLRKYFRHNIIVHDGLYTCRMRMGVGDWINYCSNCSSRNTLRASSWLSMQVIFFSEISESDVKLNMFHMQETWLHPYVMRSGFRDAVQINIPQRAEVPRRTPYHNAWWRIYP